MLKVTETTFDKKGPYIYDSMYSGVKKQSFYQMHLKSEDSFFNPGVFLAILGGGVPPGSPNPDPILDQKISFSTPVLDLGPVSRKSRSAFRARNQILKWKYIKNKTAGPG